MPSFIRPTYKIVMEEFSSWRPCLGCFHSSRHSSPTADIKDRNLRKRLQKFCRISTLKSSNAPIGSAGLWSCPNAGSSSAPSHGSIAAAMATAAAPSYYKRHRTADDVGLLDGGVWANNPIALAVVEAISLLGWRASSLRVLSLGCVDEVYMIGEAPGWGGLA